MKTLISTIALAMALGFTGPAFAGDVSSAKTKAECDNANGFWNEQTKQCEERGPNEDD